MYFLFGLITALFTAVMIIEHQGIYFFDEEVYGLLYTDYWNYWYYSKVVIIALFVFCVLSFVYTLIVDIKIKTMDTKKQTKLI